MRPRYVFLLSAVLRVLTVLSLTFAGPLSVVRAEPAPAPAAGPVITATKTDRVVVGGSEANPGDTLRYTVTISNTGDTAATGVSFSDPLPAGLALVPGSLNTSPLAFDQSVSTAEDTPLPITLTGADADGNTLTFSIVTAPTQGTLSGTAPNLTYTPNPNANGSDSFTFRVNDGKVNSNQVGTVNITITAVDDPPVAVADSATVTEDAAATAVDVLGNDTDIDAGPRSIASVTQPANGTVVITGGGTGLTYQPNANFCTSGTPDTFTYTLAPGGSTATVSMTVTCVDDAPIAVNDSATVTEDSGANAIPVLTNDTDVDGGPKTISSVTQPANGTVVITGGGTGLTYAPNANFCTSGSPDTFTYTLTPGGSSATVSITVTCVDDAPVAVNDSATVTEDAAATAIDVLANDTDLDGGPKTVASVTQPANGTVVITGGGTGLTYQPNANFCTSGTPDTFTYTLNGGSTATVSVTVNCVDDNPVAVNDTATVTEDSGANGLDVLANDTDVDGGPKSISSVTQPANGTVAIVGGGTGVTYTPNANFCNAPPGTTPDTFTYTLTPGGSSATVTVSVICLDDAPVAVADSATVTEDSGANAINVLANDTDIDGGPKTVVSVSQSANGTVVITGGGTGLTYQPNANFCTSGSPDIFTYTLNGGSTAVVSVTVTCVNDAPAIDLDANNDKGTTGSDFAVTFTEGSAATLIVDPADATLTDVDNTTLASLTVTLTNLLDPGNEVLSADVTGTSITANYVPATGVLTLTGPDTVANFQTVLRTVKYQNTDNDPNTTARVIQFVANDGTVNSNTATSTVTIVAVDTPPTAVSDSATVTEDSGANAIPVLANDTDPDNGPKTVASVTQPANGTVAITGGGTGLTYTPNANFCGTDTFTYTLNGGSTATVSVTVTCVDDAPGAVADSATVTEDAGATAIDVLANDTDVDGGPKSITSVTQPANGTVVITGGGTGLTYQPNANYCNVTLTKNLSAVGDTFTYTLNGGSTATVSVIVTCVDDNPVAVNDAATVTEDSGANPIDVLANDTDVDAGPKSINSVTQPANGTVVITGGGTGLTYTPTANFCTTGTPDTFTYTLTPGGSTATVSVTVTCVDDNPVAVNDSATVGQNTSATAVDVLANDTDIDGGPKSIASVTQPANGTVVITGGGTGLTYQPNANFCNTPPGTTLDTFTYTLTPGGSSATVSMSVLCDVPPTAVIDAATVTEDSAANAIDVLANDADPDAGPKSIASVTQPANGTVAITGGGTGLTYTPNANFCGTDTFTYTLTPGGSSATVTVTVTCVDDNPVAVADAATVAEDAGATAIPVLTNDTDVDGGPISITSVTQPTNGAVVITGGGTGLTYQPNANYCGTDSFTYTLTPGGSSTTVTMTVTCVDDNPVAVADSATVVEDSTNNAINVLANDTDVDGGPISISAATQPANGMVAITGGGTGLTYTPNANYCNAPPGTTPDTFTYVLSPGASIATVSVTVTCVDDNPVAVNDSATVTEDAPATAIPVLTNDTDVDGGPKSIASVTQPTNGTVVITGGGTGLTYQPNANFCNNPPGTTLETFTYTLTPGGSSATVTVTVTCVNDPPVADNDTFDFIGNTDLVVDLPALTTPHALETTPSGFGVLDGDSDPVEGDPIAVSAITVGGCTDMSAPFDCSDPAVGRVQMQTNGRFIFTPAPGDAGATETFQYTLTDSPAVGAPASATGTVTLTRFERVWYVKNNAPAGGNGTSSSPFNSITTANLSDNDADGDLTDDLDSAGDYIFVYFGTGTATNLSSGLVLENGQHLIGEHAGLALNVNLNGNGGPTTLVAPAPGNRPLLDDTVVDAFEGVSARNVIPAEIVGMNLAGNVNAIDWTTTAAFAGNGTFTIRDNVIRSAGSEGVDINLAGTGGLTLAFYDNNLTATGTGFDLQETGTGTVTITRFDNNVVTGATGGAGINISSATFDATPGGSYQQVSGGTTVIGASGNGVGGGGLLMTNVAGDLAFTDLDIYADNGAALRVTGTGAVNTGAGTGTRVTVGTGVAVFEATNGPAVDVTNATIDLQPTSIKSTSSSTTGVSLDTVMGTFSAGSGSQITNATGTDFNINAGDAAVTYNGTITDSTGRLVSVTGTTGGTKAFTGAISDSGGPSQGIFLNSNTGATINFSGPLTLSTGSNAAFTATGGGTVTATDTTSTIATTTGTALNVSNTTIGSGGLKFKSISAGTAASGPTNGIILNNTGSTAGLTVSGTGSAGSGGTIQKTSGAGIALTNTRDVNLSYMVVQNSASDGISGSSVTNFSLANSSVTGNGDATTERGVEFTNLWGTASITSATITGNAEDNLYVTNSSGTLTLLTVIGSTFSNTSTSIGNDGIFFQGTGTAVMAISVSGSTFSNNRGDHFQATTDADTANTATVDVVFSNNTLSNSAGTTLGGGITLNPSGAHKLTFDVLNNNIQGAVVSAITVNLGTASTAVARLEGTIAGNIIGSSAVTGSGSSTGDGIDVVTNGAGTTTVAVTGNTIQQWTNPYGISLIARDNSSGTGRLNVTITGNTLANPNTAGFPAEAIFLNAGPVATDNHQVCLDLGGAGALANSFAGAGNTAGGFGDFRLRQRASTTVRLPGYVGSATDTAAVVSYIQGRNNGAETGSATTNSPPGGGFVGGAACPLPALAAKRVADAVSAAQAAAPITSIAPDASAALPSADESKTSAPGQDTASAKTDEAAPAKAAAPSDTVSVTVGTLPPGKSVTIVFDTQISGTPSLISNQGSVAGGNFATVLTDDPDTLAPGDPTVTRVYLAVKPAVWRAGTWYLRNSLTNGAADTIFMYGLKTDIPLMCDWDGDGVKTAGVFRSGAWYLKNSNTTGISDFTLGFGLPGDTPICGDWNNDGIETPGVVRAQGAQLVWYLRNSNTSGIADIVFAFGTAGDRPVVGDWDGDGIDTAGVVRGATWFLRNSNTNGPADTYFIYGIPPGDRPIAGDWDGNGTDTPGALRGNLWLLRNSNSGGAADLSFQYGAPGDTALVWR